MILKNNHLKMLFTSAIGAALTAVLAQLTIPFPIVPSTAQPLAIGLLGTVLGKKYGFIAAGLYVLMGAIGIPVFAGMNGGIGVIFGQTGGYILTFPIAAFLIGYYIEKIGDQPVHVMTANLIGTALILIIGTIRMRFVIEVSWAAAFGFGIAPFIITQPIQAIVAALIGRKINHQLKAAGLMN